MLEWEIFKVWEGTRVLEWEIYKVWEGTRVLYGRYLRYGRVLGC